MKIRLENSSPNKSNALPIIVDIACSSLSSILISWMAAQLLPITGFGIFGVVFLLATIFQGFLQGGYGDIVMRESGLAGGSSIRAFERGSLFLVILGSVGVVLALIPGALNFSLPLVSLSSCWLFARITVSRSIFNATKAPSRSLRTSASFLAGSLTSTAYVLQGGSSFLLGLSCIWGGLVVGWALTAGSISEWSKSRANSRAPHALRLGAETAVLAGGAQVANIMVTIPLGLDFAAAMRISSMLLGPISSMLTATRFVFFNRLRRLKQSKVSAVSFLFSLALALITFIWASVAAYTLSHFPEQIGGASAEPAIRLFWGFGIGAILQSFYWGLFLTCKSRHEDKPITLARLVFLSSLGISVALTAVFPDPAVFFAGTYVAQVLASAVLLKALRRKSVS